MTDRYFPFSELNQSYQHTVDMFLFAVVLVVLYIWIRRTWL